MFFALFLDVFLFYCHIYLCILIIQNSILFFESPITNLILFHCNAFLVWLIMIAFFNVLLLNVYAGVTLTALAIARMDQIDELIEKGRRRKRGGRFCLASPKDVAILHFIVVTNLFYICTANNLFYRKIFFIFIVSNVPISHRLILWTFFATMMPVQRLFMLFFSLAQMFGLFLVHFMLTFYSGRIHRPGKVLLYGILVKADYVDDGKPQDGEKRQLTKVSLKNRVKFAWLISVLHTNAKFGITYGPCGLVTLNTFARFVILYLKFLLITYKMQNQT